MNQCDNHQEGNNFLDICNCSSICCKLRLGFIGGFEMICWPSITPDPDLWFGYLGNSTPGLLFITCL